MKRWQARGEVEDSEDDDGLSLDELCSPQRLYKKAKNGKHDFARAEHGASQANADNEFPRFSPRQESYAGESRLEPQIQVARTYGYQQKIAREESSRSFMSSDSTPLTEASSQQVLSQRNLQERYGPNPVFGKQRTGQSTPQQQKDLQEVSGVQDSLDRAANNDERVQTDRSTSNVSCFLEPSLTPKLDPARVQNDSDVFATRGARVEQLLRSVSSSPLSEPPESPPGSPYNHPVPRAAFDTLEFVTRTDPSGTDLAGTERSAYATSARRNLRSRKPVQLNPYQMEMAQYKNQWRARGLQPIMISDTKQPGEESPGSSQNVQSSQTALSSSLEQDEDIHEVIGTETHFATDIHSSDDAVRTAGRLPKRRKIQKAIGNRTITASKALQLRLSRPDLARPNVPLSPPDTSDRARVTNGQSPNRSLSRFETVPDLTPLAFPTPQISSDAKHDDSEHDYSPKRSSSSTPMKRGSVPTPVYVSSGSESQSGSESESEIEAKRLRREQKRIRGVLPASWLKIDFRAQRRPIPPSTAAAQTESSVSPNRGIPQKGVARRVIKRRGYDRDSENMGGSPASMDCNETTDEDVHEKSPWRQARLDADSGRLTMPTDANVDDEVMENDFVDPMLAGRPRGPRRVKRPFDRKQQQRITTTFRKVTSGRNEFSEERIGRHRLLNADRRAFQMPRSQTHRSQTKKIPVRLSIADVISPDEQLPQFVRLAQRRTRQTQDFGRHSPTRKVLRLATANDTEDASSVLRAWREGTIACHTRNQNSSHHTDQTAMTVSENNTIAERQPLETISSNKRQQVEPDPALKRSRSLHKKEFAKRGPKERLMQVNLVKRTSSPITLRDAGDVMTTLSSRMSKRPARMSGIRGAQIETLESAFDHHHRTAIFERRMQCLTENISRPQQSRQPRSFQLQRFLGARSNGHPVNHDVGTDDEDVHLTDVNQCHGTTILPHRQKKGRSTRVNIETYEYQQPDEPTTTPAPREEQSDLFTSSRGIVLQGLGTFGTRYSVHFDMQHLPPGAFFRENTFLGSGELKDALDMETRDLDIQIGRMRVLIDGQSMEWGAWSEEVASQIALVPSSILKALQTLHNSNLEVDADQRLIVHHHVGYLLCSVVRYISKCLYFVDPVDRKSCLESLEKFIILLTDIVTQFTPDTASQRSLNTRILQYGVVVCKQISCICSQKSLQTETRSRSDELLLSTAERLAKYHITERSNDLRLVYNSYVGRNAQASDILDETETLSSVVVLHNVLRTFEEPAISFWHISYPSVAQSIGKFYDVLDFERMWRDVFVILPALEFDAAGVVRGACFIARQEGWSLVKPLVARVLELYDNSSRIRGFTVNDYVRTTFARCFTLVDTWSWWKCELVLNVMYDFFAKRDLALLRNEESRGSPQFLHDTTALSSLEIVPDDRSFHIFLKILARSLRALHEHRVYSDKKIRGIGYRLLPNHSRSFLKDAVVEEVNLEALRNHFDLLCTLHVSMPPGYRIALDCTRNLIDHSTSHREACRLSIRAWANIASFQVSTTEPLDTLTYLSEWFGAILRTTMTQYRIAKSEAERARQEAESEGVIISDVVLEGTISQNQQQVAKSLVDALAGLRRALHSARSAVAAQALIEHSAFLNVFDLFDASQHRLESAAFESICVAEDALKAERRVNLSQNAREEQSEEDSQDFGDFGALQEYAAHEMASEYVDSSLAAMLFTPLLQVLSNVFGADRAANDGLLKKLVSVWVDLVRTIARGPGKNWAMFVDEYGTGSWNQMRDTVQKRNYTAYFMARIVESSNGDDDVIQRALTVWALSLVEREARLKFQHLLTSALLNAHPGEPLLNNLPFTKDGVTMKYSLKLDELRQRRIALISCILYNMRETLDYAAEEQVGKESELKMLYVSLLRQMMQSMKANYQDLQATYANDVADVNVHGAYVDFVHQVVSLMQQHTHEICPVDRFFTDSNAFPLPVDDPTYVVGRLRSYIPKLRSHNVRVQLAVFVHTVSERAAADGQQQYLVDQLANAMRGAREQGRTNAPTLRHILLTAIYPTCIEHALSAPAAWILVLPMLDSSALAIADFLYSTTLEDNVSVTAAIQSTSAVLRSICQQCQAILEQSRLLALPHVLKLLGHFVRAAKSCLTLASFFVRYPVGDRRLLNLVHRLRNLMASINARLDQSESELVEESDDVAVQNPWPDVTTTVQRLLRDSRSSWHFEDGRYSWCKGSILKDVIVDLGNVDHEKAILLQDIAFFDEAYHAVFRDRSRSRQHSACNSFLGSVVI